MTRKLKNGEYAGFYAGTAEPPTSMSFPCPNNTAIIQFNFVTTSEPNVMSFNQFANFSDFEINITETQQVEGKVLITASGLVQGYDVSVVGEIKVHELDVYTETLRFDGDFVSEQGSNLCAFRFYGNLSEN
jgi:hypothetical protein